MESKILQRNPSASSFLVISSVFELEHFSNSYSSFARNTYLFHHVSLFTLFTALQLWCVTPRCATYRPSHCCSYLLYVLKPFAKDLPLCCDRRKGFMSLFKYVCEPGLQF